ncbi:MAG: hypothetical protein IJU92_08660 [Spirochaetaceae bacterium]|nr:hypothetical protein [Spirochaetaceae bacterium]
MKKFLAILICVSLLVGGAFAQAAELTPSVSGWATLSWGIDLGPLAFNKNAVSHGFYNDASLTVRIPMFTYGTSVSGGSENKDADVYVVFDATLPTLTFNTTYGRLQGTGLGSSLNASLHFFGAYITVYNRPDFGSYFGTAVTNLWADDGTGVVPLLDTFTPYFDGWGTTIGYANEDILGLDIGLKVGSNTNWERKTTLNPNLTEPMYALGLDFAMAPVDDFLTIGATFNALLTTPNKYGAGASVDPMDDGAKPYFNFGVGLGSAPIDGLDIKLGFDGLWNGGFLWDLGFQVGYQWLTTGIYYDGTLNAGIGFHAGPDRDYQMPGVENLGLDLAFNMYDLTHAGTHFNFGSLIGVSYRADLSDSMWIKPYANFVMEDAGSFEMAYDVGLEFSPMEKVIIGAVWNQGAYTPYTWGNGDAIQNDLRNHAGRFVLSLTLEY